MELGGATLNSDATSKESELIVNFGNLAAGLGRLLASVSSMPAFKKNEINISEWVTLFILEQSNKASTKQLARRLGVTRQRIHQILSALIDAGLIVMRVSPEDSRRNEISLTDAGSTRLRVVNAELSSFLADQLGPNGRAVDRSYREVRRMIKIMERDPVQAQQTAA
jgi:DNA-binding MarR family transcriptional regulator